MSVALADAADSAADAVMKAAHAAQEVAGARLHLDDALRTIQESVNALREVSARAEHWQAKADANELEARRLRDGIQEALTRIGVTFGREDCVKVLLEVSDTAPDALRSLHREVQGYREAIEGRETAPTADEVEALARDGGYFRARDGSGADAEDVLVRDAEELAAVLADCHRRIGRWWAHDADRRQTMWPGEIDRSHHTTEELSDV